jgi:NAD(P)-dependent dehydrogenase (short-subunit alcohol dehydrogenase family)
MEQSGRIAVVTGAASGIGRAIALRLARDGRDVAIFDLNRTGAEETAAAVRADGRRALALEVDVSSADGVRAGVERVRAELGPAHILVNNAGIATVTGFLDLTEAQWDRTMAVHLKGTFFCTRAVLPDMIAARWGRIVSIASVAGLAGAIGFPDYAAAKAGIVGLTKTLALEFGPLGITANAIAPGSIDTPLVRRAGVPEEALTAAVERTPVRRVGQPDDIAAACAYATADDAGFLTGQVLSPNGGIYL